MKQALRFSSSVRYLFMAYTTLLPATGFKVKGTANGVPPPVVELVSMPNIPVSDVGFQPSSVVVGGRVAEGAGDGDDGGLPATNSTGDSVMSERARGKGYFGLTVDEEVENGQRRSHLHPAVDVGDFRPTISNIST